MARPRWSSILAGCCAAAVALTLLVLASSRARAEGTALFSWNVPAGPQLCSPQVGDVTIAPGSSTSLGVVALGLAAPYHGYDIGIDIAPMFFGNFPDAWRFDTDGCQAAALGGPFYRPPPIESGCADVTHGHALAAPTFTRTYDAATQRVHFAFSLRWPDPVTDADPQLQYLMLVLELDFANTALDAAPPGACGGAASPMCVRLVHARMVRPDDTTADLVPDFPALSANGAQLGGPFACGDLPARGATWGTIKAQYR